MIQNPKL